MIDQHSVACEVAYTVYRRPRKVPGRRVDGHGRLWTADRLGGFAVTAHLVGWFLAVASREADGDVEASGGHGRSVHRAVMDGGNGRHEGKAEAEAVVPGAVVEP